MRDNTKGRIRDRRGRERFTKLALKGHILGDMPSGAFNMIQVPAAPNIEEPRGAVRQKINNHAFNADLRLHTGEMRRLANSKKTIQQTACCAVSLGIMCQFACDSQMVADQEQQNGRRQVHTNNKSSVWDSTTAANNTVAVRLRFATT